MREKIRNLNRYQKGVLIFMSVSTVLFFVLYAMVISRVGFEYKDHILVPSQENGATVYSGKIYGEPASFTVSDTSVVFQYGNQTYGPYIATEDSTAIPEDNEWATSMKGMELWQGETLLFRGGVLDVGEYLWLYNEDGSLESLGINIEYNGVILDENGNEVDPMEPSVTTILELMDGPKLVHKGTWSAWLLAMLICVINTATILFADVLFRFNLYFYIRNAESAEPSEWEIAGRYFSWTLLAILALVVFIWGLR